LSYNKTTGSDIFLLVTKENSNDTKDVM